MTKTIINKEGYIVDFSVLTINNKLISFVLLEGQQAVEQYNKNYIKPRWNGSEWVEGATEEEIQAFKEGNTTTEKEPNEQEILNAQLLEEIAQQKIVNAQLMQEIATLKGGSTNV